MQDNSGLIPLVRLLAICGLCHKSCNRCIRSGLILSMYFKSARTLKILFAFPAVASCLPLAVPSCRDPHGRRPVQNYSCNAAANIPLITGFPELQGPAVGITCHGLASDFVAQFIISAVMQIGIVHQFKTGSLDFLDGQYRVYPAAVFEIV